MTRDDWQQILRALSALGLLLLEEDQSTGRIVVQVPKVR